jgi:heme exporter protein C
MAMPQLAPNDEKRRGPTAERPWKLPLAELALLPLAAIGLFYAPQLIIGAPNEATMGFVQRIFYFHVPCAWLALLAAIICGVASGIFLFKGSEKADQVAITAAELTVLFGLCVVVTGPLWARKAWGVWWQWDVRLTSTMLMWIIFVSYLFARSYGGPGGRRLAAGLALFGVADVPLIYISVSIWKTIHPKTSVVPTLVPGMRPPLYFSLLALLLVFAALFVLRMGLERARARYNALYLLAQDQGLVDE